VANNFGKDAMYWYRAYCSLGRNSIVATTIKNEDKLPQHISADEKHTKWYDERVYLATTVSNGCILGSSLSKDATKEGLQEAYGEFIVQARLLKPAYNPETVNTDGWKATKNAWSNICSDIILVLCTIFTQS